MDGPAQTAAEAYQRRYQHVTEDISPKKSMLVIVIVVGCFAVLWPKVFYPMMVGTTSQQLKPNAIDKAAGCCDVFSETDMNTIKLMTELCSNLKEQAGNRPPTGKEIVTRCRKEILETCGIDISAVLQDQIRLGASVKQILNQVRSLNGSLCLKYHYGVSPWRLGVGHKIHVNYTTNMKQERPPNMRPDTIHPAFRERGSAIPKPPGVPPLPKKNTRTIEGRPGPMPGLRPTMGGPGHVVPPSTKGTSSSMGLLLPIYTIGIVVFFTYTLMKIVFKRENTGVHGNLYPPIDPDPRFRQEVFESERCRFKPRLSRDPSGRIVVNAMSALLDEVNQEIEARRIANQANDQAKSSQQNLSNGNLTNGDLHKDQEQTSVKVLGMETTASCEGGEKWNKSTEPVVPHAVPKIEVAPPQEIYLQGALPAQSQILVTDSATVTQTTTSDTTSDPAVVLAGKMTLSVISLDNAQEEGAESEKAENSEILDINGDDNIDDDILEESKYTTASSGTMAEHDVSDREGTDDENDNEEVERINELELDINHVEEGEKEVVEEEEEEIIEEEVEVEEEDIEEEEEIEVDEDEIEEELEEEVVQIQANGHRVLEQEIEELTKDIRPESQENEDIESSFVVVKDNPQEIKLNEDIIKEIMDSLEENAGDVIVKEEVVIGEVDRDLIDKEIRKVIEDAVLERYCPEKPKESEEEENIVVAEEIKDIIINESEKKPEEST